jgi:hypothetical protein
MCDFQNGIEEWNASVAHNLQAIVDPVVAISR